MKSTRTAWRYSYPPVPISKAELLTVQAVKINMSDVHHEPGMEFDRMAQLTRMLEEAEEAAIRSSSSQCSDQRDSPSKVKVFGHSQEAHPEKTPRFTRASLDFGVEDTLPSRIVFGLHSQEPCDARLKKRRSHKRSYSESRTAEQMDGQPAARKRVAIGSGPSPSSSVAADYSSSLPPVKSIHGIRVSGRASATDLPSHLRSQAPRSMLPTRNQQSSRDSNVIPIEALSAAPRFKLDELPPPDLEPRKIVQQPETRPISQEQLVVEVKEIYAGLVMVEGKCIQVDLKQAALAREGNTPLKLSNEQWQALIALHRTLVPEHHDSFLASQHPLATPAVRRLALKYAMPARLWRHGIHSFLELLRNRLPDSLDHMLAFIYLAYSMMTLLDETVPEIEDTWIECLGDLGRYRMAIEDDDMRDREVWTQVARQWYLKASDKQPSTGRLYHHLAILARPNALQQLFFCGKALSVSGPFIAARESLLTLFAQPNLMEWNPRPFFPPEGYWLASVWRWYIEYLEVTARERTSVALVYNWVPKSVEASSSIIHFDWQACLDYLKDRTTTERPQLRSVDLGHLFNPNRFPRSIEPSYSTKHHSFSPHVRHSLCKAWDDGIHQMREELEASNEIPSSPAAYYSSWYIIQSLIRRIRLNLARTLLHLSTPSLWFVFMGVFPVLTRAQETALSATWSSGASESQPSNPNNFLSDWYVPMLALVCGLAAALAAEKLDYQPLIYGFEEAFSTIAYTELARHDTVGILTKGSFITYNGVHAYLYHKALKVILRLGDYSYFYDGVIVIFTIIINVLLLNLQPDTSPAQQDPTMPASTPTSTRPLNTFEWLILSLFLSISFCGWTLRGQQELMHLRKRARDADADRAELQRLRDVERGGAGTGAQVQAS